MEGADATAWSSFRGLDFTRFCPARFLSGMAMPVRNVAVPCARHPGGRRAARPGRGGGG